MATVIPVPTLSSKGWVTDPVEKIDYLLSHYFESEDSQNVQTLLVLYGDDISTFIEKMRGRLALYLGKYFGVVNLDIYEPASNDDAGSKVELRISCSVVDTDGVERSIGAVLSESNSKFSIYVTMNNTGSPTGSLV